MSFLRKFRHKLRTAYFHYGYEERSSRTGHNFRILEIAAPRASNQDRGFDGLAQVKVSNCNSCTFCKDSIGWVDSPAGGDGAWQQFGCSTNSGGSHLRCS